MKRTTNGQHASGSAEWWTPPEILQPAREMFGGFDIDPASCGDANEIVGARSFFTSSDDGLVRSWGGEDKLVAWVNPPSKRGEESAWKWWLKASDEFSRGFVDRVFFLVFNPSTFFTKAQKESHRKCMLSPQRAARVEFRDRVRYLRASPQGDLFGSAKGYSVERGEAPPHGSALLLLTWELDDYRKLAMSYGHLGATLCPFTPPTLPGEAFSSPSWSRIV